MEDRRLGYGRKAVLFVKYGIKIESCRPEDCRTLPGDFFVEGRKGAGKKPTDADFYIW